MARLSSATGFPSSLSPSFSDSYGPTAWDIGYNGGLVAKLGSMALQQRENVAATRLRLVVGEGRMVRQYQACLGHYPVGRALDGMARIELAGRLDWRAAGGVFFQLGIGCTRTGSVPLDVPGATRRTLRP